MPGLSNSTRSVRRAFSVEEILFPVKPMRQQKSLFYAAAVPVKILSISRP